MLTDFKIEFQLYLIRQKELADKRATKQAERAAERAARLREKQAEREARKRALRTTTSPLSSTTNELTVS